MAWERMGLVRPARDGGRRVYSEDELRWLGCLRTFNRQGGVSLQGLSALLKFVPCWGIRAQLDGRDGAPCDPAAWPAAACLERVARAYAGDAPEGCRTCGIWRTRRREGVGALRNLSGGGRSIAVRAVSSLAPDRRVAWRDAVHARKENP